MTIELSFAGNPDTKVDYSYIDKSGTGTGKAIHPTWEEGDEIAVLIAGEDSYVKKEKFSLTSGAGTQQGKFYCSSSVIPDKSDGTVIKIVYPWFDTDEPSYDFSSQTGDLSSLPGWYMGDGVVSSGKITSAGATNSGVTLTSQVYVLHFQGLDFGKAKKGKTVKSLVLSRHDEHDSELSVGWKYTDLYNSKRTRIRGTVTVTPSKTFTLNSSGILKDDIYIVAPAIVYAGTFTLTTTLSDGSKMKYTWTGKSAYGNGKTYLVKGKKMSAVKSVKLPIEYVAEYNCASTTSFADYTAYHFGEEVAYFSDRTDDENLEFNYHPVTQNINIKGYHIPTIYEWYGIEPVGCESTKKTSAKISFGKIEKQSYDSQYTTVKSILYGKRFIGTDYESAYKYSARGYNVVVTVRYLGKKSGVSLSDIANSSWWEENSSEDIVRIFPELGRYETVSKLIHSNKAIYWSSTHAPVTIYYTHPHYYCSYFTSSSVDDDYEISTYENSVPVRLFSDE